LIWQSEDRKKIKNRLEKKGQNIDIIEKKRDNGIKYGKIKKK